MSDTTFICHWCVEPISILLRLMKLGNKKQKLIEVINKNFDLSPSGIKKFLNLDKPI